MPNEAIILAGGFGTRLQPKIEELPKPMAPVKNRPFIEYLLEYLTSNGIGRIVLSTGYKSEIIESAVGKRFNGVPVVYSVEEEPLGTGGAVLKAMKLIHGNRFLVLNGDTLFRIDLSSLFACHSNNEADITIALRQTDSLSRYGSVTLSEDDRIVSFTEKDSSHGSGFINGGIYLLNSGCINPELFGNKFSLEIDFFEEMTSQLRIFGYKSDSYFIDIGTPEDYERACNEF